MEGIIRDGLQELGLAEAVPPGAPALLAHYGALLLERNRVMNLTAIRDPEGVARMHMLDCAALVRAEDLAGRRLVDVGSGAGFPGLVLKILVPSLSVTLLDATRKRTDWLQEAVRELGLSGVTVVRARAEEAAAGPPLREAFDVACARAVAQLPLLAELTLPFVRPGGCVLAMKAEHCREEADRAAGAVAALGGGPARLAAYRIPGTQVTRQIVRIPKRAPTPAGYPRTWARMQKSPAGAKPETAAEGRRGP